MKNILQLTLGILTAIGGFVDIGELVFTSQAGSRFGYLLLWAVGIGMVGIILYSEMAGRVAVVTRQPIFSFVRAKLGPRLGWAAYLSSLAVNLLTCAAEVGGMALILQLATGLPFQLVLLCSVAGLFLIIRFLPFEWIERIFGLGGLLLLIFIWVAWRSGISWPEVGHGILPHLPSNLSWSRLALYAYFAVGLISSTMMPYELHFYSSGALEQKWMPKDLWLSRVTIVLGYLLGATLTWVLIISAAQILQPAGIHPELVGTTALMASVRLGKLGLICALGGMFFVVAGAAIETCLATAYITAQFFGWEWGVDRRPAGAPWFAAAWMITLILVLLFMLTGADPVQVVEYAVIFAVVALPLTYLPVLRMASDHEVMGAYSLGSIGKGISWAYFVLILIVAVLAIPLMIITGMGQH